MKARLSTATEKFEAFFVDVDPDVAYDRILTRHRRGFDEYLRTGGTTLGERAVKGTIVSSCRTDDPNFYSKNTETFKALRDEGLFDHTHYTDNNVYE